MSELNDQYLKFKGCTYGEYIKQYGIIPLPCGCTYKTIPVHCINSYCNFHEPEYLRRERMFKLMNARK